MYQKQPHNKPSSKPQTRLNFLHGKTKEAINQIFLENKRFGWEYKPVLCSLTQILNWLPEEAIFQLDGKPSSLSSIQTALVSGKPKTRFSISVLCNVESTRKDAPPRVDAIVNIVKTDTEGFRLLSEYVYTNAVKPITGKEAEDIANSILVDEKHYIHQFIKTHSEQYPTTSAKVFKDTLANWNKVF